MVLTPLCVSGTVSVARFSEGPHLLLTAIYLIREPLAVYPSLPFSFLAAVVAAPAEPRDAGNKCMLLRKRIPFASGTCMRAESFHADRLVPTSGATVNDGRARASSSFPSFSLLPSEKSERENGDKSVEGAAIKGRVASPVARTKGARADYARRFSEPGRGRARVFCPRRLFLGWEISDNGFISPFINPFGAVNPRRECFRPVISTNTVTQRFVRSGRRLIFSLLSPRGISARGTLLPAP